MDNKKLVLETEKEIKNQLNKIDEITFLNSEKVLSAFQKEEVMESDFNETTGYGYNDQGRDKIERIYAEIFKAEKAIVRGQFISGSHALNVTFFALLRPGDLLLSITGKPYDTLDEVIGIKDNNSSLKSFGVNYDQIELVDDDFNYDKISEYLQHNKVKVIEIQRSKGYSTRKSIDIDKVEKVIKTIRKVDKEVIIMIDNCYCELVTTKEPIEVGADICVGSLIKNLGGGIASTGGYIAGRKDLIEMCADRLTSPGVGKELGANFNQNISFFKGIYLAPNAVKGALKTAIFTSYMLEKLGFKEVSPKYNEARTDIIQTIELKTKDNLVAFCRGIQNASPVDSGITVIPAPMPGYPFDEVMAAGCFTQGSTIELSADAPMVPPYTLYMQGSLTYEYGKLSILLALTKVLDKLNK